jgi:signal transduction histidine kinase
MAKFTVDTHLFRELGDLLVGRDSTALVELIKNAYDADATTVTVYGEALDDLEHGFIQITDDGIGMTAVEFERGFLRIASRAKDQGPRISKRYRRRYTGSKGIGRLAAHKLARAIQVESVGWTENQALERKAVRASIDWDIVESKQTLDDLEGTEALKVQSEFVPWNSQHGTVIMLNRLRRRWTSQELGRFLLEIQTFDPPPVLESLPEGIIDGRLLFNQPAVRDTAQSDPGFEIALLGDFSATEDYWQSVAQVASWVVEIDASTTPGEVLYAIAPTRSTLKKYPESKRRDFPVRHPDPLGGPFFQARILIKEGKTSRSFQRWAERSSGVRVFVEGFRVLPYGEPGNDWLGLDADYRRRSRSLASLKDAALAEFFPDWSEDKDQDLTILGNGGYFGAVFLTQAGASSLRMLVNREGFVPEVAFDTLQDLVRKGIDLSTRVRASATYSSRLQRKKDRASSHVRETPGSGPISTASTTQVVVESFARAKSYTVEARQFLAAGNVESATRKLTQALSEFEGVSQIQDKQISEQAMLSVLASVGTQMGAFIHEINGLLAMTEAIHSALGRVREQPSLPPKVRQDLAKLQGAIGELKRSLERHASYLVDVVTPDARRRRVRASLAERFDASKRLVEYTATRRGIDIVNEIPPEIKSAPMFPAELTIVFSNLLTNAVKAAGEGGRIRATAARRADGAIVVVVENTGIAVNLLEGERWFRPFESTTTTVDPVLGQGMGLGLTITRNMLEQYGAEIRFVPPSQDYATAVEIAFPQ